jgi:hypothetical protein
MSGVSCPHLRPLLKQHGHERAVECKPSNMGILLADCCVDFVCDRSLSEILANEGFRPREQGVDLLRIGVDARYSSMMTADAATD